MNISSGKFDHGYISCGKCDSRNVKVITPLVSSGKKKKDNESGFVYYRLLSKLENNLEGLSSIMKKLVAVSGTNKNILPLISKNIDEILGIVEKEIDKM